MPKLAIVAPQPRLGRKGLETVLEAIRPVPTVPSGFLDRERRHATAIDRVLERAGRLSIADPRAKAIAAELERAAAKARADVSAREKEVARRARGLLREKKDNLVGVRRLLASGQLAAAQESYLCAWEASLGSSDEITRKPGANVLKAAVSVIDGSIWDGWPQHHETKNFNWLFWYHPSSVGIAHASAWVDFNGVITAAAHPNLIRESWARASVQLGIQAWQIEPGGAVLGFGKTKEVVAETYATSSSSVVPVTASRFFAGPTVPLLPNYSTIVVVELILDVAGAGPDYVSVVDFGGVKLPFHAGSSAYEVNVVVAALRVDGG